MRKQSGATLLEAIIALTLMATGAIALFAWMGTNARSMDRASEHVDRLTTERSTLAVIETLNPMAEPQGRREMAGLTVSWTSRPLTPPKPGRGPGGPATVFDVALYEVNVEARDGRSAPTQFTVRKLGWVTARTLRDDS